MVKPLGAHHTCRFIVFLRHHQARHMYTQNRIQDMIAKCNNGVNVLKSRAMSDVIFKCQIVLKEVLVP
ncbi:hypothetical protein V1478_008251 [Vespula squamosa]|uniref:Uncharacterized protein n=1 Tax=Vespula squamosa TaxID=30214 RepID=A0ABD2AYA0_VESSQ